MEYVSAKGLSPETIINKLSKKLGRRLAYFEDSYRVIGASENHVDIIRNSYKATWDKLAPWMPFSMFLCITMSRNSLDLKLFEWQVLPFSFKCSPRILTMIVTSIVKFLCGSGISLMAYMDNFTNQAICGCKAIFEIHVIAMVFMCCGWSINWVKTI